LAELKEKSKLLNQLIVETKKLENTISDYYSEIKKINFPERLDKIDNQISSINIGVANLQTAIQNTQTKVDSVQTSLSSTSQAIEKRFFDLENKIVSENSSIKKEIKTNRIIMICFGVIVIIGIGLMLILHYN